MWVTNSVADDVGRQAVVLGHVADEAAQLRPLAEDVVAEQRCLAARRLEEAEEYLDQRALAGAVRAHEADDARLQREVERIERGDARVALGDCVGSEKRHRKITVSHPMRFSQQRGRPPRGGVDCRSSGGRAKAARIRC